MSQIKGILKSNHHALRLEVSVNIAFANLVNCIVVINQRLPIIGAQRSRTKKSNVKDGKGDISVTNKRSTRSRTLHKRLSTYAPSDLAFCL